MTPAIAVCTLCSREFKAPMDALRRTADAQANLQQQFDTHKCQPDAHHGGRMSRKIMPKPKSKPEYKPKLKTKRKPKPESGRLEGWNAIAKFLGQTPAVAQRWHESGMPVERSGRLVSASPQELTQWVGTEAGKGKPVHITMDDENLLADLKEGLAYVRRGKGGKK